MPEKETKKKSERWAVELRVIDETKLPIKVIANAETEEALTVEAAIARLLNDVEDLKEGLL